MQKKIHFPSIDGLRFLAFFLVFFHHCQSILPARLFQDTGWIGVELFFLISGFLLTKLLKEEFQQNNTINVKYFYIRRLLRIWPLYFFYLIVISIYAFIVGPHYFYEDRLLGNIFFYDNILSAFSNFNPNSFAIHLWSISMEEQYYLFLPFAIPWLLKQDRQKAIYFFIALFLLLLVSRSLIVMYNKPEHFIYVLPFSGDCFLAGMLIGLGLFDKSIAKINSLLAFAGSLFLLVLLYCLRTTIQSGYHQVYVYSLVALAFSLLLISTINNSHNIVSYLFSNKPIRYLGKISFGLYIYHIISIYGTGRLCDKLGLDPQKYHLILAFSVTILLSVLSYEFFEKHILRYKKRFVVIN